MRTRRSSREQQSQQQQPTPSPSTTPPRVVPLRQVINHKNKNPLRRALDTLSDWYLVYELRTSLYTLEPWEKVLFNSSLIAFLSMGCYTAYIFLPRYANRVLSYFNLI